MIWGILKKELIVEIFDKSHFSEKFVEYFLLGIYIVVTFWISHFCPPLFILYPDMYYVKEQNRNNEVKMVKSRY